VRHAEKYPQNMLPLGGRREKAIIPKENNFQQPGERFRSWDPARQERFIVRLSGMLSDPRCTQEIRRVWVGYMSQADPQLGQRIAAKLQANGAL
jgi:catalase